MARIYISSTFEDLKEHRTAVYHALRQMRHDVISMEDYTAGDRRPVDKCLADVAASDLYVGIFAWRYGFIPPEGNPERRSITELEYLQAGEANKPRLIFLLDGAMAWPPALMDSHTGEAGRGESIRNLRDALNQKHVRATFKTPDDLARQVSVAINQVQQDWMAANMKKERRKLAEESEQRSQRPGLRVVGQHVLDVGEHFKGRVREQRELGRLLADKSTRVVSVIGRPGIGKTALATKVLGDLESNRWPHTDNRIPVDGIVYLSTRSSGVSLQRLFLDAAALLGGEKEEALTRVWANAHHTMPEKIERLLEAMDEGLYVLLLDHMEDLIDSDGRIADPDLRTFFERSLAAPHGARVLLTSRTPLAFDATLLRFDNRVPLTEGLSVVDGTAFLREMDPSGVCGFRDLPEKDLARAVERLHGIPRALEVLAGIAKAEQLSSLDEILDRLHEKDAVDAMIKEGYRRLDAEERKVMECLAVLGRPVRKVAVEFMLAPFVPGLSVEAVLRRLIDILMVDADRVTKQVKLNPIDQDYAQQQLAEEGAYSRVALERRAAEFYSQLRVPRDQWRGIVDFEPHLLEFEHRVKAGDHEAAAEVLSQIDVEFAAWRGNVRPLQEMHHRIEGKIKDPRLRMLHARGLGQTYVFLGLLPQAIDYLAIAQSLAREIGDRELERSATGWIGETNRRLGRLEAAMANLEAAVPMNGPAAKPRDTFLLLLGLTYSYARKFDDAIRCGKRLMDLAHAFQDRELEAQGHDTLSLAHLGRREFDEALAHAGRAIDLYQATDARDPLGYVLNAQGMAQLGLGQIPEAVDSFEKGIVRGKEDDSPRVQAFCLFNLARAHWTKTEVNKALEVAALAEPILNRLGPNETDIARSFIDALRASKRGDPAVEIRALLACARSCRHNPDVLDSSDLLLAAEAIAQAKGLPDLAAEARAEWTRFNPGLA